MKSNPTHRLKTQLFSSITATAFLLVPLCHGETILTSGSFSTSSGAGGTGGGTTNCMIMSDGTTWSGGAAGVQGTDTIGVGGITPAAATVAFKFNIGSFVDSLNTTYGIGGWSITNPTLTLQYTLYANNSRFGSGAGTFDIYWVGTDDWAQATNNPAYATDAATLSTWSSAYSNLGEQTYDWTTPNYVGTAADLTSGLWSTDKTGVRQSTLTLSLDITSDFLTDILKASTGSNSDVSLYLMPTSDEMGITIFTGGGSSLPTLKFDVVATPEPSTWALLIGSLAMLFYFNRRSKKAALHSSHS